MNPLDQELYRLFADKTLSDGCIVCIGKNIHFPEGIYTAILVQESSISLSNGHDRVDKSMVKEILGHPPQLHDVFRVGEDREIKLGIHNTSEYLYSLHVRTNDRIYYLCSYNPTKSLLEQSNHTKRSLIDLFS